MFITFEGIDGSGKSTQAKMLYTYFKVQGKDVILESDPSMNTHGGLALRDLVLKTPGLDARTQHLLFSAARRQLIVERIEPALNRGAIVICDRFEDSSRVYQKGEGYGDMYEDILRFANPNVLEPDITFFITLNPVAAMNRILDVNRANNLFDNVKWEELADRHQRYLDLFEYVKKYHSRKVHKINGLQQQHLVKYDIMEVLKVYEL